MPIVKKSSHAYAETVAKLSETIVTAGNTVFLTLDQAAAARSVGFSLRPTTLIVFGNPRGGTPLMDEIPLLALDLPLKLLVWEQDGAVNVAYTPMSEIAARYGVTGDARVSWMDAALAKLTDSVSAPSST
jgi:uncharacterized protein (DUF302 family)